MTRGKAFLVDPLDLSGIAAHHLGRDMIREDGQQASPPLNKGEVDQRLAVEVEDIEDERLDFHLLLHLLDPVLPSEPSEHGLEREGFSIPDRDHLPVKDHVVGRRPAENPEHIGEGIGDILEFS
ncbi:MAG: hypothetical protein A4E40_01417 [Methanoregulaceae archaeon PtaU1.Bin059]|nr:MAG: hypothetical protein A4E40_01417 [Methanoregulaceae archaeon PtaU1.Bin059]